MSEALHMTHALARRRREAPLRLHPATTALLAVDLQEYFLRADSPYSRLLEARVPGYTAHLLRRAEEAVLPHAQQLLRAFRDRGCRVLWTALASALPDGADLPPALRRLNGAATEAGFEAACPWRGSPWAAVSGRLAPAAEEPVVHKTTFGAFASTRLDATLRHLGVETVVVCGVVTNVCVESTAREAVDHGLDVVICADACAAYAPEVHEATLLSFQAVFGQVRTTAEILALLEQG